MPDEFLTDPAVAAALLVHDIATVFRHLRDYGGLTQRTIAAYTGVPQSEVCKIIAGRAVTSYPVLECIALGLGIPRGRLGLAWDTSTAGTPPQVQAPPRPRKPEGPPADHRVPPPGTHVMLWTGKLTRILRLAKRMGVKEFAAHIGVSARMVSKWEAGGGTCEPRWANQEALDTILARLRPDERARFNGIMRETMARDHA